MELNTGRRGDKSEKEIGELALFRGLPDDVLVVRHVAFFALLLSERLNSEQLSLRTGLDPAVVEVALRWLDDAGLVEQDADDDVIGIAGLTLESTKHQLDFDGQFLHTWCAIDAVGIPAALSLDAHITTACEYCGASLAVDIHHGEPPSNSPLRGWIPPTACDNVRVEVCPFANLFCSEDHLNEWLVSAGNPQGQPADLARYAQLGRQEWGNLAPKENE